MLSAIVRVSCVLRRGWNPWSVRRTVVAWVTLWASVALWIGFGGVVLAQGITPPDTLQPPPGSLYLPQLHQNVSTAQAAQCPLASSASYDTVAVIGPPLSRSPVVNPDINLALRGYIPTTGARELVNIDGPTDDLAPQLGTVFADRRPPLFTELYRVRDWDWPCATNGCMGQPIPEPPVTLVALESNLGESVGIPWRGPQIYNGGYIALVLYAEANRLTFTYTREDNPAIGYLVHMEDFCVDPNLLALYRQQDALGRSRLPALRPQDLVGSIGTQSLKLAIRDTGSFMDPRSRKDWWVGY